jgi:hypothetical protein
MSDKIINAVLMGLGGAMLVGILYVVFAPGPDAIGAVDSKETERLRATLTCIEQSGASKERDYRVAGYKATKCAEQPAPEALQTR